MYKLVFDYKILLVEEPKGDERDEGNSGSGAIAKRGRDYGKRV
jgi:hypothetical protein